MQEDNNHSIVLDQERCIGCTDCIKRCPTEAIRVRNGKAKILNERCIDCGNCIRVCQHKAKKATTDPLKSIHAYKCKIAIPAPTLYGQFNNVFDSNTILTALKRLGFDDVFEVAAAAEEVTDFSRRLIAEGKLKKPLISSACPAINRLIMIRYPSLVENIVPVTSPMELAAISAKNLYEKKGFRRHEIGVFFISPCAAKATEVRKPLGIKKSEVDGIIGISDIYRNMLMELKQVMRAEVLSIAHVPGMDWAANGGEGRGLGIENVIAVDGVENVIHVLEELENGQLDSVDFIEGLACIGGCLGGPLTVTNNFIAKNYLRKTMRTVNGYCYHEKRKVSFPSKDLDLLLPISLVQEEEAISKEERARRIIKLEEQSAIYSTLPHIDCGSCGAPNCRALAEDIVNLRANVEDCTFMLRDRVRMLAESMVNLAEKLPPSLEAKQ